MCQQTFEDVKQKIVESSWLVHYDPTKSITLVCDASPHGVGAVLNIVINGNESFIVISCLLVYLKQRGTTLNFIEKH